MRYFMMLKFLESLILSQILFPKFSTIVSNMAWKLAKGNNCNQSFMILNEESDMLLETFVWI